MKVGLIGSSFPLTDAVVSPKDVRVTVDKKLAKDAPSIETDGQLEAAMDPAVFGHYGLVYSQGVGRAPVGAPLSNCQSRGHRTPRICTPSLAAGGPQGHLPCR